MLVLAINAFLASASRGILTPPPVGALTVWTLPVGDGAERRGDVRGQRMRITERTPAELLKLLPKKKLADHALVSAPEKRGLPLLTGISIERFA